MSWDNKKFAICLLICMAIVFSFWFYFQGRELDYDKGYNLATERCNAYLANKTCIENTHPIIGSFNATNVSRFY